MENKEAKTKYRVLPAIKKRWSPRAFDDKPVEKEKIRSLFEAARWTPSRFNQQPWRYVIGFKGDETYTLIMDTLIPNNQRWAFNAPVLIAAFGRKFLNESEDNNTAYQYDTGQSVAFMTFQATEEGLHVRQMGGFSARKMVENFQVPVHYKPLTVLAVGYLAEPNQLPKELELLERKERTRFDFDDIVFSGNFGRKSNLFDD